MGYTGEANEAPRKGFLFSRIPRLMLKTKKPFAAICCKGLCKLDSYFVPETVVEWSPTMFPITPKKDVQSAGVEWMLVIFTFGPFGTKARAAA